MANGQNQNRRIQVPAQEAVKHERSSESQQECPDPALEGRNPPPGNWVGTPLFMVMYELKIIYWNV